MRIKNYKSDIQEFRAHKNQVRQNLKKQKKGKQRLKQFGKIDIPQSAFLEALKTSENNK